MYLCFTEILNTLEEKKRNGIGSNNREFSFSYQAAVIKLKAR